MCMFSRPDSAEDEVTCYSVVSWRNQYVHATKQE